MINYHNWTYMNGIPTLPVGIHGSTSTEGSNYEKLYEKVSWSKLLDLTERYGIDIGSDTALIAGSVIYGNPIGFFIGCLKAVADVHCYKSSEMLADFSKMCAEKGVPFEKYEPRLTIGSLIGYLRDQIKSKFKSKNKK